MIKVSIVTIVRNDHKNIEKTMLSVLEQSYTNYEYIVKDGFSSDGTQNIIERVCLEYPDKKIKYVSSRDAGIYDAMNQAIKYCEGEWIIFINSGDSFWNSSILQSVFEEEKIPKDADVLFGDAVVRDETGDVVWKADITKIEKKMPFCHQSCFMKKKLLIKMPFNTSYRIAADYNNILDIYKYGAKFLGLNQIIAVFALDGISSTKFIKRYRERNQVRKRHRLSSFNYVTYVCGFLGEIIKTIVAKIVPYKIQKGMRQWYKKYIKRYERNEA